MDYQLDFSRNRNKILALGPNDAPIIFNASVASGTQKIIQVGEPIFSFYGYSTLVFIRIRLKLMPTRPVTQRLCPATGGM